MKKPTLSVVLLFASVFAFAKGDTKSENATGKKALPVNHTNSQLRRVAPQTNHTAAAFYTEDFAGGLPAGWTNVDGAGSGVIWSPTTTGLFNQVGYPGLDL